MDGEGSQIQITCVRRFGQASDGSGLRTRKSHGSHRFVIDVEHPIGGDRPAEVGVEPLGDRVGRTHRQLLADDRDHQGVERITLGFAPDRAQR